MCSNDQNVLEFWEQPYCLDRPIKPLDIVKFKITGGFSHISFYVTSTKPEVLSHERRGLLTSSTDETFKLQRSTCKYVGHIRTTQYFTVVFKSSGDLQISTKSMNVITSMKRFSYEDGLWLVFMSNFSDISVSEIGSLTSTDLKESLSLRHGSFWTDDIVLVSISSCQTEDLVERKDAALQVDQDFSLEVSRTVSNEEESQLLRRLGDLEKANKDLECSVKKLVKALHNKTENHIFENKVQELSTRLDEILGAPLKPKRDEGWKEVVRKNYTEIVNNIEAQEIAQYMFQHKVISLNTFDRIRQIKTAADASHEILTVILRKPVSDVLFCDCLKKTEHHHVFDDFFQSNIE